MTHTFHKNYYHLVWSTKDRQNLIIENYKNRVHEYLGASFKTVDCRSVIVGGMGDHVHLLAIIPPKYAIAEVIKDIKIGATKWINRSFKEMKGFSWQEGYGCFSVSESQIGVVLKYIMNQETHHKHYTFKEEFTNLLRLHEIEYDEKYLWM